MEILLKKYVMVSWKSINISKYVKNSNKYRKIIHNIRQKSVNVNKREAGNMY